MYMNLHTYMITIFKTVSGISCTFTATVGLVAAYSEKCKSYKLIVKLRSVGKPKIDFPCTVLTFKLFASKHNKYTAIALVLGACIPKDGLSLLLLTCVQLLCIQYLQLKQLRYKKARYYVLSITQIDIGEQERDYCKLCIDR